MAILRFWRKDKEKDQEKEKEKEKEKKEPTLELGIVAEFNKAAEKCREKVKKLAAECHKHNRKYRCVV